MPQAKMNDAFRQYMVEHLGNMATSGRLRLILSFDPTKEDGISRATNIRATHETIKNTETGITITNSIEIGESLLKIALKATPGITKPQNSENKTIMSQLYYISEKEFFQAVGTDLWNAFYVEVPLPENNPNSPSYYNLVSVVITHTDAGKIDANTVIVSQEYLTTKTTLPEETAESTPTLKVLLQL